MWTLDRLAKTGRWHWKRMMECIVSGYTEGIYYHNEQWNNINQLIRDGKYRE